MSVRLEPMVLQRATLVERTFDIENLECSNISRDAIAKDTSSIKRVKLVVVNDDACGTSRKCIITSKPTPLTQLLQGCELRMPSREAGADTLIDHESENEKEEVHKTSEKLQEFQAQTIEKRKSVETTNSVYDAQLSLLETPPKRPHISGSTTFNHHQFGVVSGGISSSGYNDQIVSTVDNSKPVVRIFARHAKGGRIDRTSLAYKIKCGWKPSPAFWQETPSKPVEASVFLTLSHLNAFVAEHADIDSIQRDCKNYSQGCMKFEVLTTIKLSREHMKRLFQRKMMSIDDLSILEGYLKKHAGYMLCFSIDPSKKKFDLDLKSTSVVEVSEMYKERVSKSTQNLFLTTSCSCGHASHTPRLSITINLFGEVVGAVTISPFTIEFEDKSARPLTVLEIEGLAVKKGKLLGKGIARLLLDILRHIAHRLQIDLDMEVGMVTKTSNDSAGWWATVPSFFSFREASKKMSKTDRIRWKTALQYSQSNLHMFYSHADLSRSYLWATSLDDVKHMESLEITYSRVLRRVLKSCETDEQ